MSGSNLCECWCSKCESNGGGCCHELYPLLEHTADELATLARFDAAEPAPESYVQQHQIGPECWCGLALAPGTKFGVLMHRKVEGE